MERSALGEGEIPAWNLTWMQDQGLGDQTAGGGGAVFIGTQSRRGQRKPTDMGSVGKSLVKTEKW